MSFSSVSYPLAISERRVHLTVGYLALSLPCVVIALSIFGQTCYYSSLSHYAYGRLSGPIFNGALSTIAILLLFFTAPSPAKTSKRDLFIARLAGLNLIVVLLFPTDGSGCLYDDTPALVWATLSGSQDYPINASLELQEATFSIWSTWGIHHPILTYLHFWAAGISIVLLGYFPLIAFRRHTPTSGVGKPIRNRIYLISGVLVLISMTFILAHLIWFPTSHVWVKLRATFWLETIALTAFGLSWLTKGRFVRSLND